VPQPTGSAPAATPIAPPVAAPPVTAPPAGTATAPSKGTPALVLDTEDYEGLLGKSVRAQNGDDLGRIIDVIIDRDGRPRAAIIDFGGFLGVGSRKIAVDWRVLKFVTEGKVGRITLALNRNQVRVSPEYKTGEPIVVLGASGVSAPQAEGDLPAAASPQDKATVADKPGTPDKAVEKPEKAPDR
ncbi:PRC-barrel domain-containing protein, partial [Methylobacterium sp. WL9]|uniref:PRC-barrel domain-containing protein n=1 Tax=Methylobacterium sp. WL9 TaxID=2603898 RepID=UPI0011CB3D7E